MNTLKNMYMSYKDDYSVLDDDSSESDKSSSDSEESYYNNENDISQSQQIDYETDIVYREMFEFDEIDNEDDTSISYEINYETDIVYSNMCKEYTCKCNTLSYQCLCNSSLNLFRCCKNYQKILDSFPDIQYIMNLHLYGIQSEYKIQFTREINLQVTTHDRSIFFYISSLLLSLISISRHYIKKYLI